MGKIRKMKTRGLRIPWQGPGMFDVYTVKYSNDAGLGSSLDLSPGTSHMPARRTMRHLDRRGDSRVRHDSGKKAGRVCRYVCVYVLYIHYIAKDEIRSNGQAEDLATIIYIDVSSAS